jgi:bifunctional non-homologous end joining protein LigD
MVAEYSTPLLEANGGRIPLGDDAARTSAGAHVTPPARVAGSPITNPSKLFWPDDGITKLDLARFYAGIARHILPWLRNRPLTMERCPDGLRGTCFYQKQAPANRPAEIPTVRLPAPSARKDVDYVLGGSRRTLLWLVNLGCIAMHVMDSRADRVTQPDWLAFDLDPSDGMASAARVAVLLRARLEDHGLESFVKTSGGRGLHVLVPLRRGPVHDRVRAYAASIAAELAAAYPKLATVEARKASRRAPVYVDVLRNAPGQTMVPPFSVRRRARAPVSTPLDWKEVSPRLDPSRFTIRTIGPRLAGRDPWERFFARRQTLPRV